MLVFERLGYAFLPLFVAFDVIGLLPVYWGLAQGLPRAQRQQAVHNAVIVAFVVALVFLWVSEALFRVMGLDMADLLIAGGAVLFIIALHDLLNPEKAQHASIEAIGVVPLGVPLIVGPAVLTTVLLSRQRYGLWPTVAALSVNVLLTWAVLQASDWLMGRLGRDGARVVSKVFSLVLAALGVMLVRQGIMAVLISLQQPMVAQ